MHDLIFYSTIVAVVGAFFYLALSVPRHLKKRGDPPEGKK